ncbi:conserved Plasmodium protein, unknown function [Plasmodium ovale wallikeri]|uniref:Uncharacterized protein n=1 Tax=Plasmodium ovale wallikeri TaxID=864142 RepID=A0A1A8YXN7_PLAOA|nr:conserved Plasmodium protein, unknown function [Plasmodium ovale wallikeri]
MVSGNKNVERMPMGIFYQHTLACLPVFDYLQLYLMGGYPSFAFAILVAKLYSEKGKKYRKDFTQMRRKITQGIRTHPVKTRPPLCYFPLSSPFDFFLGEVFHPSGGEMVLQWYLRVANPLQIRWRRSSIPRLLCRTCGVFCWFMLAVGFPYCVLCPFHFCNYGEYFKNGACYGCEENSYSSYTNSEGCFGCPPSSSNSIRSSKFIYDCACDNDDYYLNYLGNRCDMCSDVSHRFFCGKNLNELHVDNIESFFKHKNEITFANFDRCLIKKDRKNVYPLMSNMFIYCKSPDICLDTCGRCSEYNEGFILSNDLTESERENYTAEERGNTEAAHQLQSGDIRTHYFLNIYLHNVFFDIIKSIHLNFMHFIKLDCLHLGISVSKVVATQTFVFAVGLCLFLCFTLLCNLVFLYLRRGDVGLFGLPPNGGSLHRGITTADAVVTSDSANSVIGVDEHNRVSEFEERLRDKLSHPPLPLRLLSLLPPFLLPNFTRPSYVKATFFYASEAVEFLKTWIQICYYQYIQIFLYVTNSLVIFIFLSSYVCIGLFNYKRSYYDTSALCSDNSEVGVSNIQLEQLRIVTYHITSRIMLSFFTVFIYSFILLYYLYFMLHDVYTYGYPYVQYVRYEKMRGLSVGKEGDSSERTPQDRYYFYHYLKCKMNIVTRPIDQVERDISMLEDMEEVVREKGKKKKKKKKKKKRKEQGRIRAACSLTTLQSGGTNPFTSTPFLPLPHFTSTPFLPLPHFTSTPFLPLPHFTSTPFLPLPHFTSTPFSKEPRRVPGGDEEYIRQKCVLISPFVAETVIQLLFISKNINHMIRYIEIQRTPIDRFLTKAIHIYKEVFKGNYKLFRTEMTRIFADVVRDVRCFKDVRKEKEEVKTDTNG